MPHAWPPPGPMRRPAGEPGALTAEARRLGGAAEALRDAGGRLRGTTSFVVDAGAWRGPASEAFLVDAGLFQSGLGRAADALGQAAGALAELAARLGHAQASWDRARRLAAVAGVDLGPPGGGSPHEPGPRPGSSPGAPGPAGGGLAQPPGDPGGVRSPATAVDPLASVVAGQALRMAEAAELEAAAARRAAAARLEAAGHFLAGARRPAGGSGRPGGPSASPGRGGHGDPDASPDGSRVERAVGRALEAGAEVATATHHLVSAAEARLEAAGRLAATADDPAVRAAAGRVVETAGRPLVDGTVLGALPLAAPILELGAALHDGEPLPRALAGALGSAVGADLGGRAGLAACGGEAAVTEGVGLIVCPTFTAVGGALGAQAGRAAALHVYDELAGAEPARPPDRGPVRPGRGPGG